MRQYYYTIALFLCTLVISLPFITSVEAGSLLQVTKISGRDGVGTDINGYKKFTDDTHIDVEARIDRDSEISNTQVRVTVGSAGEDVFDSCVVSGGSFTCNYIGRASRNNVDTYKIKLYNDSGVPLRSVSASLYLDSLAPDFPIFSVSPKLTNGQNITISYTAQDYAYNPTETTKCSGLTKVEIYKPDGTIIKTETPTNPTLCTLTGSFKYTATEQSGTVTICARGTDGFNQVTTTPPCDSFEIDKSAPQVRSARIYKGASLLRFVSDNPVDAQVVVNISGTDINTVNADISDIDPSQTNVTPVIITSGSNTLLYINAQVRLSNSKTPTIRVYGKDMAGNAITPNTVSTQSLTYDSTGPTVTSLGTRQGQYNGEWIVGTNTSFIALLNENANNMGMENINLDMTSLGLGNDNPDNCTSSYTCHWYDRRIPKPSGTIAEVTLTSTDDLGNAGEPRSIQVKVDTTSPTVESISYTTIHGAVSVSGINLTVKGDKVNVVATLSEATTVSATADFSSISTSGTLNGNCQKEDTKWTCSWQEVLVDKNGPFFGSLKFNFKDFAGNTKSVLKPLYVSGIRNETNPHFWSASVKCSPEKIDRQVTTLSEQRSYCNVHLIPLAEGVFTSSIELGACTNIGNASSLSFVSGISIMNNGFLSTDPYLKVVLKTAEMKITSLDINCPLIVHSVLKQGNNLYVVENPETVNAAIGIEFYNMPLSSLDKEVNAKIEEAKNGALVSMSIIGTLQKFMTFARTICSFLQVWNSLVQVWAIVSAIWTVATTTSGGTTSGWEQVSRSMTEKQDKTMEGFVGVFRQFCMYVSCDVTLYGSWYNGYLESIKNEKQQGGIFDLFGKGDIAGQRLPFMKAANIGQMFPANPSKSIILSLATGCIPGIIDGLQRWRQIQCNYGVCLKTSASQKIPLKACEDQKSYLECKFIFGEIFQIIPYANFFKSILNNVYQMISDPIALVFSLSSIICSPLVTLPGFAHPFCVTQKAIQRFIKLAADIMGSIDLMKSMFSPANDMCKELEKTTTQPTAKKTA